MDIEINQKLPSESEELNGVIFVTRLMIDSRELETS